MPDWSDPPEIAKDAGVFQKLLLVMLGLYTWEIIVQLPFDWSIVSRKREAHWPSFLYFHCKYSLWLGAIGVNIATNVTTKINCQALYTFNQFAGNTAIGSASTLLMLRTIAIWKRAPLVTVPLIVISLGQWSLLFHGIVTIRSRWSDVASACVVDAVHPLFTEAIYLYTMSLDLIVLVLTMVGLVISPGRSSLWSLLFRQGVIYFLVAFVANVVPTVFLVLNLNPIMNIMFALPSAIALSVVACRSFISLTNFRQKDVYIHSSARYPSARLRPGGSSSGGDVVQVCPGGYVSDSSLTKKKDGGSSIAGIIFRNMGAGVDSMGQVSMSEVDKTRMTSTLAAVEPDEDRGVVVHMQTIVHGHDDGQSGDVNMVDLEKVESLGYGQEQKSRAPNV